MDFLQLTTIEHVLGAIVFFVFLVLCFGHQLVMLSKLGGDIYLELLDWWLGFLDDLDAVLRKHGRHPAPPDLGSNSNPPSSRTSQSGDQIDKAA